MSEFPRLEGIAPVSHLGVIRARGEDAASFLQGQLTSDVAGLDAARARLAGYCSAKGRLLATFIVVRPAPDEFWLVCSADLLAPTLKRLSMFVLRARCKLADAGNDLPLRGLVGSRSLPPAPWQVEVQGTARQVRLPDAAGHERALWIGPGAPPAGAVVDPALWRWLEVESGMPWIEAANVEQFVPQMVNLELAGGVDFRKGCYPGQEVVARSQYRGTLKRRMVRFDSASEAHAGDDVFEGSDAEQPAGRVVTAAQRPGGGFSALIEMKLAALDGRGVHLRSATGPELERRELPYPLDPLPT